MSCHTLEFKGQDTLLNRSKVRRERGHYTTVPESRTTYVSTAYCFYDAVNPCARSLGGDKAENTGVIIYERVYHHLHTLRDSTDRSEY